MTAFLTSIGGKLAERWASAVLLPGILFVVAVLCAVRLGHSHAFSVRLAETAIADLTRGSGVAVGVRLAFVLLGAATAVLVARTLGLAVRTLWFGRWNGLLGRLLVRLRRRRAVAAADRAGVEPVPAYLPARPTWIGEQFRLADAGIAAQYQGLRLGLVWPRLWVLLPDSARSAVQTVNTEFQGAAVVAGWGLMHLVVGVWWFPSAIAGIGVFIVGWVRARGHAATLSVLIESAVDTHLPVLLEALSRPMPAAGVTADLASQVNDQLQKGR
jgi:hypothetical protein